MFYLHTTDVSFHIDVHYKSNSKALISLRTFSNQQDYFTSDIWEKYFF
eukprot:UN16912